MSRDATPFTLGPWHVEPAANEIRRDSSVVRLEPKAMAVLAELAARPGRVVTRDALAAAVWPGVVVTEASLTRCVSHLRQALDDDSRAPRLIETVPTVGYRLLATPEPCAPVGAASPPPGPRLWPSRRLVGAVVVALVIAVVLWALWPAPLVVSYQVDVTGDAGPLLVRYTRPDGSIAAERLRAFPATREVRTRTAGGHRYEIRAAGMAGDAEVTLTVVARRGRDVLARSWAMGRVSTGQTQRLDVHTHVEVE